MTGTSLTSAHQAPPEVFNAEELIERCMGNLQLAERLVQKFASVSSNDLRELRSAVDQRDFQSVRQTSHRLKGSAASVGCPAIAAMASKIEQTSQASDPTVLEKLVADLGELQRQFLLAAVSN